MSELFHEFLSNNFTITQEIKTSSKSRIVLAINKLTNQPCIIKYLYHNTSPYDELKKLSHNCFPEIYYLYQDESITIIVEEYINGRTLFNILEQQEQLSDDIIKKIIIQLCEGLKILHEHNILHRDIKPSNIMLTKDNIVKLIDFDTARLINPDKTYDTEYLGTRGYAPPEQYGFAQTDIRSDIYALGITLQKLQKIIKKAIKFDPDRRYQSVNEILQEFVPMATWKKFLITVSVILLTLILIIISYSYYLNKTSETPTDFDIQKIEDDLKQLPEKIDTEKIKQEIKDLPQKNPFNDIKPENKSSTPKNNETTPSPPAPTATPNDEKNPPTNQKPRRKYTREYLAEHVPFTYDIDGSFSPTTLSWQDYGDYIGGRGTLHFKIVNNTDIDLPLNYEFVTHGMKIPTSAVTTSDNLSLTDLDIYPGDGIYGATTIFILPKKDISPNEVCEIWIDLSQCKLYDKTLYEDFSKKVDLSNGLPTNSTLDKDKNGPYMIDISFYSPILDIIYLYNDEFPVY